MRHLLTLLGLACILCSCGNGGQNNGTTADGHAASLEAVQEEPVRQQNTAAPDTAAFQQAFDQFFNALQSGDTAALNAFIDPEQGLWLIEQPGALPSYTHFSKVQEVKRQYQQRPFTSINQQLKQCQLQQREAFPEFDCADMDQGASGYAEDGCFYTTNTSGFQNSDMWQYANLTEQQAQQVQEMQQQVEATVLHTGTSYRFHFGYRNGRWRLLFADLRVPCSA
ncbi:hypothetical protein [Pontibacter actiniarum]|uniref:DUF4440 domain-containing protein n=1 Tax=Pontibacter actiniarum TaxID=323450 RepID=A0A1X9YUB7_9BACT|nr:hypothetical protein [Pontibacter actiniarum]ARS36477.1 hypothetical protein CA264_14120 [Pontibacter actiniarum]